MATWRRNAVHFDACLPPSRAADSQHLNARGNHRGAAKLLSLVDRPISPYLSALLPPNVEMPAARLIA